MIERIMDFVGAALISFGVTTTVISSYHHYILYALLIGVGLLLVTLNSQPKTHNPYPRRWSSN